MKFSVYQPALRKAIASVLSAVGGKHVLPVLTGIRFVAHDDRTVLVQASNLEMAITYRMAVYGSNMAMDTDIVVPAKLLNDLVNQLPDDAISWESTATSTTIKCRSFTNTISCMDAQDYPVHPTAETMNLTTTFSDTTLGNISQIIHAAAQDGSRPVLTGVLFQQTAEHLSVVAADGFRLARFHMPLASEHAYDLIIPATTMQVVAKLFRGAPTVTLYVAQNKTTAMFVSEDVSVMTRIIDGKYPDVARVIPEQFPSSVVVSTKELLQALKVTSLFSSEVHTLAMRIDTPVSLRSVNGKVGESSNAVSSILHGEPCNIAVNAKYTYDALVAINAEEVMLSVISDKSPLRITAVGSTHTLCLVMPVAMR